MGAFSIWHWVVVLAIVLLVFGPGRLGNLGRDLGKSIKEFKGAMNDKDITPDKISATLDTRGMPDPDLLIRTSGEMRLSNFLLWQAAYAEFVFVDANWPDFGRELLEQAIAMYAGRTRRFGGLTQRSSA